MKIKVIKTLKYFPFTRFEESKAGYRFKAELYQDSTGQYEMKYRGKQLFCREDGEIEMWLDSLDNQLAELQLLRDFLKDVHYEQNSL